MKIKFHGHSCLQVEEGGTSLIFDPFLQGNPVAKVTPEEIKADYIILTHGHNDHVGDAEQIAKQNKATIIAPYELAMFMEWKGCQVHGMSVGGAYSFDFGRVKFTQAFHGSAYTDDEKQSITYMGMPAGIVLTMNGKTIYHAGDTSLFSDMKLIGEQNEIDVAFLPIGDNYTMGPDDALLAAEWIQAKQIVPIHYNTLPIINQDGEEFIKRLEEKGMIGKLLHVGDELEI